MLNVASNGLGGVRADGAAVRQNVKGRVGPFGCVSTDPLIFIDRLRSRRTRTTATCGGGGGGEIYTEPGARAPMRAPTTTSSRRLVRRGHRGPGPAQPHSVRRCLVGAERRNSGGGIVCGHIHPKVPTYNLIPNRGSEHTPGRPYTAYPTSPKCSVRFSSAPTNLKNYDTPAFGMYNDLYPISYCRLRPLITSPSAALNSNRDVVKRCTDHVGSIRKHGADNSRLPSVVGSVRAGLQLAPCACVPRGLQFAECKFHLPMMAVRPIGVPTYISCVVLELFLEELP